MRIKKVVFLIEVKKCIRCLVFVFYDQFIYGVLAVASDTHKKKHYFDTTFGENLILRVQFKMSADI